MTAQQTIGAKSTQKELSITAKRNEVFRRIDSLLRMLSADEVEGLFATLGTRPELYLQDESVDNPVFADGWVVLRANGTNAFGVAYVCEPRCGNGVDAAASVMRTLFSTRDFDPTAMTDETVALVYEQLPDLQVRLARLLPHTKMLI